MQTKPIIGITIDYPQDDTYAKYPWYALRRGYTDAVALAGGVAILLPYNHCCVTEYCSLLDGLVLVGGDFDIDPSFYNEAIKSSTVSLNNTRIEFEIKLLRAFLSTNKPILGICAGMQLINVIFGGTLIQDIAQERGSSFHMQEMPKHVPSHEIEVAADTQLFQILGCTHTSVNTTHHQAVKKIGSNLVSSAIAKDGIIEAIEHTTHPFCIGVQWHPEYSYTEEDRKIFKALISATKTAKA